MAIADVKPGNLFLDPSKLLDGAGPLVQLIDYGAATNGTIVCLLHVYVFCGVLLT